MAREYPKSALRVSASCPWCGAALVLRTRRDDRSPFVGCGGYPRCRFAEPYEALHGALLEELAELRAERLEAPAGVLADRIRALLFEWHPDRHPEPIPSGRVVAELNRLREMAREAA